MKRITIGPCRSASTSYDPFGGIYRGDLNLQVYWDDNADKLARFQSVLDQTDYIFIPTNHQYAQITRIPERYPADHRVLPSTDRLSGG